MTYCTHCGQPLVRRYLADEARERDVCAECGSVHYINPQVLVWCVAYWKQQMLFCRRAKEPALGLWEPPGGYVESGETLQEAAARETFEEAGLRLDPSSLLLHDVLSLPHMNQILVGFRVQLPELPTLLPGPEILEARFFAEADVKYEELAFGDMVRSACMNFFQCIRSGDFPPPRSLVLRPQARDVTAQRL